MSIKNVVRKTLCKIGIHNKTSYMNSGVVNSVKMYHRITKCKWCNKHFTLFLLLALTVSCVKKEVTTVTSKKIVAAKTIDQVNGNTRYNIAFKDGSSRSFSFGLYTKYKILDTVTFQKKSSDLFFKVVK